MQVLHRFRLFAIATGIFTLMVGLCVLAGWACDVEFLKNILPAWATMKVNTALCFTLIGGAALLFLFYDTNRISQKIAAVTAIGVSLIGFLTLLEYISSLDLGLDQMIWRDLSYHSDSTAYPGRMASVTAFNFVLLGLGFVLMLLQKRIYRYLSQILLAIPLLSGLHAFIGYLYGTEGLYAISIYSSVAFHTALTFVIISLGLLCAQAESGFMSIITNSNLGGELARRFLPSLVLIVVLCGWFRLYGQHIGLYGTEFGVAIYAITLIVLLTGLVMITARLLNGIDCKRKRVEAEKERQLRAFIKCCPLRIGMLDCNLDYLAASDLWLKDFGNGLNDLVGLNQCRILPSMSERWREAHRRCLQGEVEECGEEAIVRFGGKTDWLRWQVRPWTLDNGEIGGVLVFAENITQNKKAEQSRLHSEKQLRLITDTLPSLISYIDRDFRCQFANVVCEKWFGISRLELVGRPIHDLLDSPAFDLIRTHLQRAMTGEPISFDANLSASDGLREFNIIFSPEFDENNHVLGVATLINDVTEQRRREDENSRLSRQAAKEIEDLKQALDQSSIVAFTDAAGKITHVNDKFCEISQYSRSELHGETHQIVNSGHHSREFFVELWEQISSGKVWSGEIKNRAKDRTYYWVFTTIIPFLNSRGMPYQYVAIRTDITEHKRIEAERSRLSSSVRAVIEASRLKSEFLAMMSHEIRTPINGVIGTANLLLESRLSIEQREYAETIMRSADDLLMIINDILDFSKIEANKLDLEMVHFDIKQLLLDVKKNFLYESKRRGVRFSVKLPPDLPSSIKGDPGRLRQILNNLLSNAFKFTPAGRVDLRVMQKFEDQGKIRLRFEIQDTGIGIDPNMVDKLFEPFTQADASTTRKFGGTGLGLTICKRLVEIMKGEIGVTGAADQGSIFWFEILADIGTVIFSPRQHRSIPRAEVATPYGILVAEDNPINQKLTINMLERLGYRADPVGNGKEVIEAVHQFPYDLILMDCQMPEMDGFQTTRAIRANRNLRIQAIPVIAMTANALVGAEKNCLTAGMNDYLSKPVYLQQLSQILGKWIGQTPARICDMISLDTLQRLYEVKHVKDSPIFVELVSMFENRVPQQLLEMREDIKKKDFESLARKAHNLKSASAILGAKTLVQICIELEQRALQGQDAEGKELLTTLGVQYKRAVDELQQMIEF